MRNSLEFCQRWEIIVFAADEYPVTPKSPIVNHQQD
jgi:hypothetical protein